MKKSEVETIVREVRSVERGETARARVREVTLLPDGRLRRVELKPEAHRRKQARAWKAKNEAAKVLHELNLTENTFAELLGVSLATVRKWERSLGEPSGAAKILLPVARINPEVIREAVVTPIPTKTRIPVLNFDVTGGQSSGGGDNLAA